MRIYKFNGEEQPLIGKISPMACSFYTTPRALCTCCYGPLDIHRALLKCYRNGGRKPKYKDHRK